jgi:hypothetical protein
VLCDLYRKETGNGEWHEDGHTFVIEGTTARSALPSQVMWWADLPSDVGATVTIRVLDYSWQVTLVDLNDGFGIEGENTATYYDFNQIADVIEEKL